METTENQDWMDESQAPGYLNNKLDGFEPALPAGSWERLQDRTRKRRLAFWWWSGGLACLFLVGAGVGLSRFGATHSIQSTLTKSIKNQTTNSQKSASPILPSDKENQQGAKPESNSRINEKPTLGGTANPTKGSSPKTNSGSDHATPNSFQSSSELPAKRALSVNGDSQPVSKTTQSSVIAKRTSRNKGFEQQTTSDIQALAINAHPKGGQLSTQFNKTPSQKGEEQSKKNPPIKPETDNLVVDKNEGHGIANNSPAIRAYKQEEKIDFSSDSKAPLAVVATSSQDSSTSPKKLSVKPIPEDSNLFPQVNMDTVLPKPRVIESPWLVSLGGVFWQQQTISNAPLLAEKKSAFAAAKSKPSYGVHIDFGPVIKLTKRISFQPTVGLAVLKQASELNAIAGEAASIHFVQGPGGIISATPKVPEAGTASSRLLLLPQVGLNLQWHLSEKWLIHTGAKFIYASAIRKSGPQGATPVAQWPQYSAGLSYQTSKRLTIQAQAMWLQLKSGAVPGAEASRANLFGLGLGLRYGF